MQTCVLAHPPLQGALSHPLIPDLEALPGLTPDRLRSFVATRYAGPRLVLAAAGVEHAKLVELATPMMEKVGEKG